MSLMRWVRRIIVGLLATAGLFAIVTGLVVFYFASKFVAPSGADVPDVAVLELDLTKPLAKPGQAESWTNLFGRDRLTLPQAEEALVRASKDSRVKGVMLRLGRPLGIATAQELRDSLASFRKSGKFAIAFAESYGDGGSGASTYYVATACEEIWLQPSGEIGLTGVFAETTFLKGTLDKLGVSPRFGKREEYKTAIDQLTDASYSHAFRESMESLVDSLYDQLVQGIADGRALTPDAVKALIDRGPFLASEALQDKLVDRLGYRDEANETAKARAGTGSLTISLRDYYYASGGSSSDGRVIAFINGNGPIVSGDGDFDGPFGVNQIGADMIVRAFDQAAHSRDVAAILFRIDSPGGSAVASDTIWRAVERAKARGKPVIVSMGSVAASGGYFVSAPANKIVAEPGTLTGSIGVFGGKFVIKDLLAKLGVSSDYVQRGANADMWSASRDFSDEGWHRLDASLDAVYHDFTTKVGEGRKLDASRIPLVAKGRVFTGADAQRMGLVDALGGFSTALALARESAGIAPDEPIQLRSYPRPRRRLERLVREIISDETRVATTFPVDLANRLATSVSGLAPLIADLPALVGPDDAYLLLPPLAVRM